MAGAHGVIAVGSRPNRGGAIRPDIVRAAKSPPVFLPLQSSEASFHLFVTRPNRRWTKLAPRVSKVLPLPRIAVTNA